MTPHADDPHDKTQPRAPRDVGRTSGGGSLGHKQPREVEEATGIRNNEPGQRERQEEREEPGRRT